MCCGGKRQQQFRMAGAKAKPATFARPFTTAAAQAAPPESPAQASSVYFQYVGKTGLTIESPTTGKRYRFDKPGDQLAVDPRDRMLLLYVPNLRPVRVAHVP